MKCTAHKTDGQPCGKNAVKGATVCATHGASAPQVKRAAGVRAARLEAHAVAARMVARAGVDVDPIEHLLESLHRAAALVEVWGTMVAALDAAAQEEAEKDERLRGELRYTAADEDSYDELSVTTNERLLGFNYRGEATLHPFVVEYQSALDRRAKFAKLCIDAGIAEREVRLTEERAYVIADALRRVFDDTELGLTAEQRQAALQIAARELRAISVGPT